MEKRFILFIMLSMGVLIGYQALEMRLNPPPPVDPAQQQAEADGAPTPADGATADGDTQPQHPSTETSPSEPTAEVSRPEDVESTANADAAPGTSTTIAQSWATLGTLDKTRPEKLLVWLTNRGASIECIALNDTRYQDLDDHHGYLGFLALEETANGLQVGAVGDGTPAAAAGLRANDVIQQIDSAKFVTLGELHHWMETTRPGQTVSVQVLRNDAAGHAQPLTLSAELGRRPLEIVHPEPEVPTAGHPTHPYSYQLSLNQLGDKKLDFGQDELANLPSLRTANWEMKQIDLNGQPAVQFEYVLSSEALKPFHLAGPLRVIKRFSLAPNPSGENVDSAYHLNYELIFRNEGSAAPITLAYRQLGPTGMPLEGWWYTYKTHPTKFGGAGVRDVIAKSVNGPHKMFTNPKIVERLDKNPENPATPMFENESLRLQYVGVDAQYFASALLPEAAPAATAEQAQPEAPLFVDALAVPVPPKDEVRSSRTDVTFALISPPLEVKAGQEVAQRFRIFAGPKKPSVLTAYGMDECITYGWFPMVVKPLQFVLHTFYKLFRNYGIAIILLTVLVRGCMYPFGRQQALNAQKMQQLAPEMKRITEQYKNDLEKRAAAQRELFQKHNYNPLAGCLPMFLQLPIFAGLYRALSIDIELRQASLIPGLRWCSNLAGPDQLWNWESWMPAFISSRTGWLGPYLNVLPIVSVTLMMIHQKMFTPPPTDEQQEMQQRIMKFMMFFMALMFFRVPAGLCLYLITSSAWGLTERLLLPKPTLNKDGSLAAPPPTVTKTPEKKATTKSEPGFLERLREKADAARKAQQASDKRQNKSNKRR